MAIKYRKIQRKVLNGPEKGMTKTYGIAKASYYCDLPKLCNLVANRTAMSPSEVKGMFDALVWVINTELNSGAIVQLGELCSVRYVIQSKGTETPKEFTAHQIVRAKVRFTPGILLKDSANRVGFEADKPVIQPVEDDEEPPTLPQR